MERKSEWTRMIIQSLPVIQDPRELQTILTYSLRDLFGELEAHSCSVEVKASTQQHSHASSSESNTKDAAIVMIVECPSESAKQVRAAMTMCTPPPYLEDTHFRLDVIDLETFQK